MQTNRSLADKFWLVLKGIAMGAANKVPGVSGGLVAFVAGFYEEFIHSLKSFDKIAWNFIIRGEFRKFLRHINASFLSLLVLGIIISFFSVSKILDYLLVDYELYVWSLFFGMILGSVIYLIQDFEDKNKKYLLHSAIGIVLGLSISFINPMQENTNLWFVFFCGFIGVSGMTLPGLSGSFLIMLLGNYVLLLVDSVNALYDSIYDITLWNWEFLKNPERVELLWIFLVFSIGSIAGLIGLSHLLSYILKRYRLQTFAMNIGFIIGSLSVVWPWKKPVYKADNLEQINFKSQEEIIIQEYKTYLPQEITKENLWAFLIILLGIGIVLALEYYARPKKH